MDEETMNLRIPVEDVAALHSMASRVLASWEGEEGRHVDLMTSSRRHLEAGLRSIGWAPTGDGGWVRDSRPMRGRR